MQRGDILLVDYPERGLLVRRVSAVGKNGGVGLRGSRKSASPSQRLANVDPDRVRGKLALTIKWARFLPYFGPPLPVELPVEPTPESAQPDDTPAPASDPARSS
ncbi:MAG: hypothetical protein AAFZ11_01635 [Pseudomonadota bacterium]